MTAADYSLAEELRRIPPGPAWTVTALGTIHAHPSACKQQTAPAYEALREALATIAPHTIKPYFVSVTAQLLGRYRLGILTLRHDPHKRMQ